MFVNMNTINASPMSEMENEVLISVVVPAYNRLDELRRALRSVLSQTFQRFEVIVVDDGSEMDIKSLCESFGDERILYIRNAVHTNANVARNRGIYADGRRGAGRDGRPRQGRHDDDGRHARDGLCAQGRESRDLHRRRRPHPRGLREGGILRPSRESPAAHQGLPRQDPGELDRGRIDSASIARKLQSA